MILYSAGEFVAFLLSWEAWRWVCSTSVVQHRRYWVRPQETLSCTTLGRSPIHAMRYCLKMPAAYGTDTRGAALSRLRPVAHIRGPTYLMILPLMVALGRRIPGALVGVH